jgi:signal transduction histidine kinase
MNNTYQMQKTIALIISGFLIVIMSLNHFSFSEDPQLFEQTSLLNFWTSQGILAFILLISFASLSQDNKFWKIVHVALFVLVGVISIIDINSVDIIYGEVLIIVGIALWDLYGIVKPPRTKSQLFMNALKYFLVLITLGFFKLGSLLAKDIPVLWPDLVNSLLIVLLLVVVIGTLVQRKVKEEETRRNRAVRAYLDAEEYIYLGQATRSILHNIKTREILDAFKMSKGFLERGEIQEAIETIDIGTSIVYNVEKTMFNLTSIAKYRHQYRFKTIDLNDFINDVVNHFHTLGHFHGITVDLKLNIAPLIISISPADLMIVVENLIRNSIEALKMQVGDRKLLIQTKSDSGVSAILAIEDNAGGIQTAPDGIVDNGFFEIGKTTKPDGQGWGVVTVLRLVTRNRGKVLIYNKNDYGLRTQIHFGLDKGDLENEK